MSKPFDSNPFIDVYNALWEILTTRTPLDDYVAVGNRISFAHDANPVRPTVQPAQLPELTLVSDGFKEINIHSTATTSKCVRKYSWVLCTGEMRYDVMYPIEWLIYVGMHGWSNVLKALTWPDNSWHYVKRTDLLAGIEGRSDPKLNRGVRGWSTLWSCEVEMHFKKSDIESLLIEPGST